MVFLGPRSGQRCPLSALGDVQQRPCSHPAITGVVCGPNTSGQVRHVAIYTCVSKVSASHLGSDFFTAYITSVLVNGPVTFEYVFIWT